MALDDAVITRNSDTGCLTINTLKYIAIVAMVIDHSASAFIPSSSALYIVMRFVGRITGPVMFFAAAEAYHRTGSINKYVLRLAVFTLISYLPFIYFLSGGQWSNLNFLRFNVIYTIFLGVAAIHVRHVIGHPVIKVLLTICLVIVSIPGDWGITGVLMMLTFDYFRGDFKNQALGFSLIVLLKTGVLNLITQPFSTLILTHSFSFSISDYAAYIINAGQFLPIILIYFYNNRRGRGGRISKWFFYIFYPLHLLILGLLQAWLK